MENAETSWSPDRCKVELDLYLYAISAFREKTELKVNSLDLVLTEKCSLKCKDCGYHKGILKCVNCEDRKKGKWR